MAEYYAIERTPEYLMHYGIRGMKWGVRKAIARGDSRALGKQYAKAQKKLAKLSAKADIQTQSKIAKKYGKIAKISGGIGASAAGLHIGSHKLIKKNWRNFHDDVSDIYNAVHNPQYGPSYGKGGTGKISLSNKDVESLVGGEPAIKEMYNRRLKTHNALNTARLIGAGVGVAGLGTAAVSASKAGMAKYRTTTAGHAAAVAKRDEFQREMNKAFAGTAYANGRSNKKNSAKVVGIRVGKHFVGVSNKPITEEKRNEVRRIVNAEYARSHKKRK